MSGVAGARPGRLISRQRRQGQRGVAANPYPVGTFAHRHSRLGL